MTISNVELQEKCDKKGLQLDAIIMANELSAIVYKKTLNIIINLDSRDGSGGTHWVSLCVRNKEAFYFDSYGATCDKYVVLYCKKNRLTLGINTYIIQHLTSVECGLFCYGLILFLRKERLVKGIEREFPKSRFMELCNDYINMFDHDTEKNDVILFNYIR